MPKFNIVPPAIEHQLIHLDELFCYYLQEKLGSGAKVVETRCGSGYILRNFIKIKGAYITIEGYNRHRNFSQYAPATEHVEILNTKSFRKDVKMGMDDVYTSEERRLVKRYVESVYRRLKKDNVHFTRTTMT